MSTGGRWSFVIRLVLHIFGYPFSIFYVLTVKSCKLTGLPVADSLFLRCWMQAFSLFESNTHGRTHPMARVFHFVNFFKFLSGVLGYDAKSLQ